MMISSCNPYLLHTVSTAAQYTVSSLESSNTSNAHHLLYTALLLAIAHLDTPYGHTSIRHPVIRSTNPLFMQSSVRQSVDQPINTRIPALWVRLYLYALLLIPLHHGSNPLQHHTCYMLPLTVYPAIYICSLVHQLMHPCIHLSSAIG